MNGKVTAAMIKGNFYQQRRGLASWHFQLFLVGTPSLDSVSSTGQVMCVSLMVFSFERMAKMGKRKKRKHFAL